MSPKWGLNGAYRFDIDTQFFYFPEIGRMVPLFVARSAYVLPAVRWSPFRREDCSD